MSSIEQRLSAVEVKQRDLEAELRRVRSDIAEAVDQQNKAAIRMIEQMIERDLGTLRADIEEIKGDNKAQLALLTEAAEERGRRKQREEELALRSKQASISGAQQKTDADVERFRTETSVSRWKGYAAAVGIVLAAAGVLAGYVYGSHH